MRWAVLTWDAAPNMGSRRLGATAEAGPEAAARRTAALRAPAIRYGGLPGHGWAPLGHGFFPAFWLPPSSINAMRLTPCQFCVGRCEERPARWQGDARGYAQRQATYDRERFIDEWERSRYRLLRLVVMPWRGQESNLQSPAHEAGEMPTSIALRDGARCTKWAAFGRPSSFRQAPICRQFSQWAEPGIARTARFSSSVLLTLA